MGWGRCHGAQAKARTQHPVAEQSLQLGGPSCTGREPPPCPTPVSNCEIELPPETPFSWAGRGQGLEHYTGAGRAINSFTASTDSPAWASAFCSAPAPYLAHDLAPLELHFVPLAELILGHLLSLNL